MIINHHLRDSDKIYISMFLFIHLLKACILNRFDFKILQYIAIRWQSIFFVDWTLDLRFSHLVYLTSDKYTQNLKNINRTFFFCIKSTCLESISTEDLKLYKHAFNQYILHRLKWLHLFYGIKWDCSSTFSRLRTNGLVLNKNVSIFCSKLKFSLKVSQ